MGEPTTLTWPAAASGTPQPARLGTPGVSLPPLATSVHGRPANVHKLTAEQVEQAKAKERRAKARRGRAERWQRRHELRSFTTLPSVKRCGVAPIPTRLDDGTKTDTAVSLHIKHNPDGSRTAGLGGLQHCGSVWGCPVCSAPVATQRAAELASMLKWALHQNYSASFMTLTVRHHKRHRLKQQWDAVAAGWKAATGGKQWVKQQQRYGLEGWVKVVEATHRDEHGWHVHLHVLLIWNRPESDEVRASAHELAELLHARWTSKLEDLGFESWRDSGGLDVRMASLDPAANGLHEYFTKLAFEVSGGYAKQAAGKGRAPFQILADVLDADGEDEERLARDFALWEEWEQGSKKRKQMAWSKGLRERAALGAEQSDEELANANEETPADETINLTPLTWAKLARDPWDCTTLLDVAEDGGMAAACAWLDERGYRWYWPPPELPAPEKPAPEEPVPTLF